MAAIGPFVVEGPQGQIDLIQRALDRLDTDVDVNHFIRSDFEVVFRDVPNVPGTQNPAYGFFKGATRRLLIRHGMPNARDLRKTEVEYTFLHEAFGHGGELDGAVTDAKRHDILAAMGVPLDGGNVRAAWRRGSTPAGATVPYWSRPYEAYCDLLVSAVSDVPALFERRYKWDIDPDQLKKIVLRNTPPDPPGDPIDDPDPITNPDKKSDDCADLRHDLEAVTTERHDLKTRLDQVEFRLLAVKQKAADIAAI